MTMLSTQCATVGLGLLFSHVAVDFLLQPTSWVEAKNNRQHKAWQLYAHAGLAGLLAAIALWGTGGPLPPLLIGVTHCAIDYGKVRATASGIAGLLCDQLLHVIVLALVWLYVHPGLAGALATLGNGPALPRLLVYGAALILSTSAGGIVIGQATQSWRAEIEGAELAKGLQRAGMWIGILERSLILIFVLVSSWEAIGFLITAKTILRFKEIHGTNERKVAEYILIGTLISFLWAILIGLAATWALAQLS